MTVTGLNFRLLLRVSLSRPVFVRMTKGLEVNRVFSGNRPKGAF